MRFDWVWMTCALVVGARAQTCRVVPPHAPPPPPPSVIEQRAEPSQMQSQARTSGASIAAVTTPYSIGQPTDDEQYYLELINRARATPAAEGVRLATTTDATVTSAYSFYTVNLTMLQSEFNALPVRPPLAMNSKLMQAARGHSQDMLVKAYQDHIAKDGRDPGDRVAAAGYPYSSLGENIYSFAKSVWHGHAGFEVDWGGSVAQGGMQSPRGHRESIHSASFREVGIGVVNGSKTIGNTTVGPLLVTQDFGSISGSDAFVTGVAYYDLNGNNFYDPGEGIGGLTVNVQNASFHAVTSTSGGYAAPVPVANATRAVTFSGLGINGGGSAVIASGSNAKVDLKPAYVSLTLAGPSSASTTGAAVYNFNAVGGATGYEWRRTSAAPVADDEAENVSRVTVTKTGSYGTLSTAVKHAGSSAYRLAHPSSPADQAITYNANFLVSDGASVTFRSRLTLAGSGEVGRVQVSENGGASWTDIYSQAGTGGSGEASFANRSASLAAYQGKEIRLRFIYTYTMGTTFFPDSNGSTVGWFIDSVSFTNVSEFSNTVINAVPLGTSFAFTPPTVGNYQLSVRPLISGRAFPFGPPLNVTGIVGPPPPFEIGIQLAPSTDLVDGSSTVACGAVTVQTPKILTFNVLNQGTNSLSGISLSVDGSHALEFVAGALGATTVNAGQSTAFAVTFTPAALGTRQAVLHVLSNDPNESPFDIALTGTGDSTPFISQKPQSLMKVVGQQAKFTVTAIPLPLTYQWRKGAANVGANLSSLTIDAVKLTDAGPYIVLVKGSSTVQSDPPAQLGVVENVEKTVVAASSSAVTLTCNAAGNGLQYQWFKGGLQLSTSNPRVSNTASSGPQRKTVAISALLASDSANYICRVTNLGGAAFGGTTTLKVYDSPPDLDAEKFQHAVLGMPNGIVGGTYSYKVPLADENDVSSTPTSYSATKLPPGLKIDPKTGIISGKPTVEGFFDVSATATNAKSTAQNKEFATKTVHIAKLPDNIAGVYTGWVEREADLNGTSLGGISNDGLGGRLDLTVAKTGVFTGSLIMGITKYALIGSLEIDVDLSPAGDLPKARLSIKRAGTLVPMELTFEIENSMFKETTSKVTSDAHTAKIKGWRQTLPATNPYAGYYTMGLRLASGGPLEGNAQVPQGWGLASFTVAAKDGKLTMAGKTADGEKLTASTFVGPSGQVLVYQVLYTTPVKGSLLGQFTITAAVPENLTDNTLNGDLDWVRPTDMRSTARTYEAGFGATLALPDPLPLKALGGHYVLQSGQLILGLATPGSGNASVLFYEGGLDDDPPEFEPDYSLFSVGANNAVTPLTAPNEAKTKLTVVAAKGTFAGAYTLSDPNPRHIAPDPVVRSVKFEGLIIKDGDSLKGHGYFLLPKLPDMAPPTTPTTSAILSGNVLLQKN